MINPKEATGLVDSIAGAGPDPLKGTPWEEVAERIPDGASVEEILRVAKLNWEVVKLPVFAELEYKVSSEEHSSGIARKVKRIHVPKNNTIIRLDNHQVISPFTGDRYKLIQNEEAFRAFEQFCLVGDLTIETAGSLSGGKHIWALASIGEGYELSPGEVLKGYFLLMQSHFYGHSLKAMFTPVRYPGGLTIVKALNVKGKKGYYSMPHSRVFSAARRMEIEALIERAEESMESYVRRAKFLANANFTESDGVFYLISVWDDDKNPISKKLERDGEDFPKTFDEALNCPHVSRPTKEAICFMDDTPGIELPSNNGTGWGYYNVVAYGLDKAMGMGVNTRLESAWMGRNVKVKAKALNLATTMASTKIPANNVPAEQTLVLETEDA